MKGSLTILKMLDSDKVRVKKQRFLKVKVHLENTMFSKYSWIAIYQLNQVLFHELCPIQPHTLPRPILCSFFEVILCFQRCDFLCNGA